MVADTAGISLLAGGIDIGTKADDLPVRRAFFDKAGYSGIMLSAAMGPWEAGSSEDPSAPCEKDWPNDFRSMQRIKADLETLRRNIMEDKGICAVGEIGLDYYWKYGTREKQLFIFESQMQLAHELNLPVLIHNREADTDTADVISRLCPPKSGIIHCFSGNEQLMHTALDNGFYISFAGNLTFKNAQNLRDRLKEVPLDRLLFETDSPYLTPVPHRGQPNRPDYVVHVYECASQVLGIPFEELATRVLQNFRTLFPSLG